MDKDNSLDILFAEPPESFLQQMLRRIKEKDERCAGLKKRDMEFMDEMDKLLLEYQTQAEVVKNTRGFWNLIRENRKLKMITQQREIVRDLARTVINERIKKSYF